MARRMVHAYNVSTWKEEARGLTVGDQLGPHNEAPAIPHLQKQIYTN